MAYYTRHLPHWHPENAPLFVTWCLHGAFPRSSFPPSNSAAAGKAFVYMDRYLDAAQSGPTWLKRPKVASLVADALHFGAEKQPNYDLHAWVIMSNHVHMLITPQIPMPKLMQSIKGFTARQANRLLDRKGEPFWQHESYDHVVRDKQQFERIARYIADNPVRAGLAASPGEYRWSSSYASPKAGIAG